MGATEYVALLRQRVPDVRLLQALRIFSPQCYPEQAAALHNWGVEDLRCVSLYFYVALLHIACAVALPRHERGARRSAAFAATRWIAPMRSMI